MLDQELFDYASYMEAFNSGDDDVLVDRFFTDDVLFAGSSMTLHGREEVRAFLHRTHDGILETMRPQKLVVTAGQVAAEIDMDFQAVTDSPGFVFGALRADESLTVKFFNFYEIRGKKIAALRAAVWAPGRGVSERPTSLSLDSSGKRAFFAYTAAFNNGEIGLFTQFYAENVELVLPSVTLRGKAEVAAFYEKMFAQVTERLILHSVDVEGSGFSVDLTSTFTAHTDAPDLPIGPLTEGQSYEGRYVVFYQLSAGKITKVDAVRTEPLRGPFSAE
ncbi:nuclear transport factor 2 family protein [Rhodococcus sp. 06-235-1A]|uniref:nuclear transport factor 2 family protein n=1 Tax=Rhodococcus sp. 06-235-1A TaxID=2022508 RepID=UPI0015C682AE|nr:nuclear transport factor 2 family protein [Rhodococcus sp. 06-235-1A]